AGGVVDGRAEQFDVIDDIADAQDLRVPAGDEQGDGRRGQPVDVFGHEVDGDVGGQMVDPVQRSVEGGGESFGRSHSDHERSGQTGTGGHGDGIDIGQLHLGGLTGRGDG